MSGSVPAWIVAIVAALLMIRIGVGAKMLSVPWAAATRCGACRRHVKRGEICRCADPSAR
jgi:hypothetical protein